MTNPRNIQTAVRSAVCILLTVCAISGCAAENGSAGGGLTDYALMDAVYTAEFPSGNGGGSVTGVCQRSGATTVLRVTSPERLNGLTVTYDGAAGVCSVAVGEMSVLLSPEAAAGLTDVFDLLARTAEDGGIPSKSADGQYTVITFSDSEAERNGSVTVAPNEAGDGVPVEVTLGGRTVRIGSFTIE